MRRRLGSAITVALLSLWCAPLARAEAILTLGGLSLQPDANGLLQFNVDVDLAGAAPNLVSFDFDVLHAGLSYVGHSIGDAFDADQDPSTTEHFDATLPDAFGQRQNMLAILETGYGAVIGRLFSMTFQVSDPNAMSLSLLGFPLAELFEGNFRSESLVSEVAPFDLQPVPFIIRLASSAPGVVTMLITSPGNPDPDPGEPPTTTANEPATVLMTGLGLFAAAAWQRRRTA